MSGETDVGSMLEVLTVTQRAGTFVVVRVDDAVQLGDGIHGVLTEEEGTTVVATTAVADSRCWHYDFQAAWLTLDVHSSLEAVGLTAAVSTALASRGIPCNVIAGFHHDHLLVPVAKAGDAVECLHALRESSLAMGSHGPDA